MKLRALKRAAIPIAILGIGIAANTILYSITDSVLLRPLPFPDPEHLAMAWEQHPMLGRQAVSPPDLHDWQRRNHTFTELAGYTTERQYVPLWTNGQQSEPLRASYASANLFPMLGITPIAGRVFHADEDRVGHNNVVLLSHELWTSRFGADPAVIGTTMALDGTPHVILGVLPAGRVLPAWADVWMPLAGVDSELPNARPSHTLEVVGRLRPGVSVDQADADIRDVAAQLSREYPLTNGPTGAHVISLRHNFVAQLEKALVLLQGGAALVLLICCANIAIFSLVRAAERRTEMQVRAALGAAPSRLFRDAMVDSLRLSFCGGALGVVLGRLGLDLLAPRIAELLPFAWTLSFDWRVLAFSFACCLVTGFIFGVVPALRMMQAGNLREASRSVVSSRGLGGRGVIAIQTALAMVVLICAGLLARSFHEILRVDPGFDATRLMAMRFSLPTQYNDARSIDTFHQRLFERIRQLPGVVGVAASQQTPLGAGGGRFWIEGRPDPPPSQFPVAQFRGVSPEFFAVAGLQLIDGRLPHATGEPQPAMWVNQAFARRYFPSERVPGHGIQQGLFRPVRTVIPIAGVVSDMRDLGLDRDPEPTIYRIDTAAQSTLLVRTAGDPGVLERQVRGAVRGLETAAWVAPGRTMDQLFAGALRDRELALELLGAFSLLTCLLAALGIQAVVAHAVTERTREIGLRLAMGAETTEVIALFLRRQLLAVCVGLAAGIPAAIAAAHLLRRLLFGISAVDPATYAFVTLLIVTVALVAAYVPARRAARIDPIAALRSE